MTGEKYGLYYGVWKKMRIGRTAEAVTIEAAVRTEVKAFAETDRKNLAKRFLERGGLGGDAAV